MRTHPRTLTALALTTAMASGAMAMAADLPKSGTDSYTNIWLATVTSSIKAADRSFATVELTGTTRNDAGGPMFNYVGQHCVGSVETIGSEQSVNFLCTYTDKDGDQIFSTTVNKGPSPVTRGSEMLAGDTGKFVGITGTAEWNQYTATPIKGDDKAIRGVVSLKMNWKLP